MYHPAVARHTATPMAPCAVHVVHHYHYHHGSSTPVRFGSSAAHHANPPFLDGCDEHKPLVAERFRTRLCTNYLQRGECPYIYRCMFAHGEHELRTAAMNVADGLFSEEAVKYFKRQHYRLGVTMAAASEPAADYVPAWSTASARSVASCTPSAQSTAPPAPVSESSTASMLHQALNAAGACSAATRPGPRYRHDPYSVNGYRLCCAASRTRQQLEREA